MLLWCDSLLLPIQGQISDIIVACGQQDKMSGRCEQSNMPRRGSQAEGPALHHRGFTLPGLDGREVVATAQLGRLAPEERPLPRNEVAHGLDGAGDGGEGWLLHAI